LVETCAGIDELVGELTMGSGDAAAALGKGAFGFQVSTTHSQVPSVCLRQLRTTKARRS
jgi:hypothetical protein